MTSGAKFWKALEMPHRELYYPMHQRLTVPLSTAEECSKVAFVYPGIIARLLCLCGERFPLPPLDRHAWDLL